MNSEKTERIKENLKIYYNREAGARDSSTKDDWKIKIRQNFCDLARKNNKTSLLELGAGAGYDSQYYIANGFEVIAIDISHEMIKKCREKGIEAYELDFYDLSTLGRRFDCVWAMNSLLHVPKTDLPVVLASIKSVLAENGLFYMGVYGGVDSENNYMRAEVSNAPRFFSYYSRERLEMVLEKYFHIISFEQFEVIRRSETHIFQSVIMENQS